MKRVLLAAGVLLLAAADADACGRLRHRRQHANYGVGGCGTVGFTPVQLGGGCPTCPAVPTDWQQPGTFGAVAPSAGQLPAESAPGPWVDGIDAAGNRVRVRLVQPTTPGR